MEMRDVAIVLVILAGVLALKGFYEIFSTLPVWTVYVIIALFLAFSILGIFLLLGDLGKKANTGLGFSISGVSIDAKKALGDALVFWLNWPWWILMIALWKLFELWTSEAVKRLCVLFGLDTETRVPLIGSPLVPMSFFATYIGLVLITALFTVINPISLRGPRGPRAGECPRCKAKHGLADNYCSNCGAILPRKKL